MYTKQNLIDSLKKEMSVIRHLFTKIPEGSMHHRLSETSRSTLELLQYLSVITLAGVEMVLTGDMKVFSEYEQASKSVNAQNFIEELNKNEQTIISLLENATPELLAENVNLFGIGEMTKGVYLVETILKWLPAYKMQLFLNAKSAGNTAISTSNLWGGFDMPAKS